ncbi:GAF domain-containing protein [uncultured Thermanaerothrix sp.]|uniref:GAF domain-containing protein n=1 Tax=uncultured Thermanaerothrix sp. TaxID=1195149 RepID=UPI00262C1426|nr:GAF domain-containing protein [uncultured Thermanaerothrix sp.]
MVEPKILPSFDEVFRLGEHLLGLPDTRSQMVLIEQRLREWLDVKASLWFSEPQYPLPGEPEVPLLSDPIGPALAKRCAQQRTILSDPDTPLINPSAPSPTVAFPLILRDLLLGVLVISRPRGPALSHQEIRFLETLAYHLVLALQAFRQERIKIWRTEQLTLVRTITSQITRFTDVRALCHQIALQIQETFDFYYVGLFEMDETDGVLRFCAGAGKSTPAYHQDFDAIHLGQGIIGSVAQSGQEIIARNVQQEPRYRFSSVLPETLSEAAFPIKHGERLLGVLDLQSERPNAFHEYDLILFRSLADAIAIAFESIKLYQILTHRADRISALLEINHTLTSILDLDRLLDEVVKAIQRWFGYPYVHLFSVHQGRRKIFYEAGSGARSKAFEEHQISYDLDDPTGIIPWVAREGKVYLANDVESDSLYRPSPLPPETTRSELAIPLAYGGEVLGVLDLQSDHPNAFDPEDLAYLEALGASIAIAMRNAMLYRTESWRRQVADSFRDIAGLISENVNLEDLLERILAELEHNLPCEAAAIWLLEEPYRPETKQPPNLRLAAVHGIASTRLEQIAAEENEARQWLEHALQQTEPSIRKPIDPYDPLGRALGFPADYSAILAPLKAGGQVLGLLLFAHHTGGRYGSEALLIAATLASYAAVAIQNNRLFASAQEQAWISTILLQVAETNQTLRSVEELAETLTRLIPLLVGIKECAFFIWDDARQAFFMLAEHGLPTLLSPHLPFDSRIPAVARLLETREPVFIQDPAKEISFLDIDLRASDGTYLVLPLISRNEILGALLIGYHPEHTHTGYRFDPQLLAILQGIAQQAAMALENIRLLDARQEEAYVTAALLQVAQAIVSQTTLDDMLDTTVHLIPILVGAEACAIYLWDAEKEEYRLVKAFDQDHHHQTDLEGTAYPCGHAPLLDFIHQYDTLITCPLQHDNLPIAEWAHHSLVTDEEVETKASYRLLGIPLSVKGERYGALLVRDALYPSASQERRLEIITGIAQQIALAIQNEHLNREMLKRERLEREVQVARQIQKTFLPTRFPEHPHWEIGVYWEPARQVGGDFYDIIRLPQNRWGVVVGDVSDKGVPAALYMTVSRTLIRAFGISGQPSPARILQRANRSLVFDSPDGLFVTAIYAILHLDDGRILYANAGHNWPLIFRADGKIEALPSKGMALGIVPQIRLQDQTTYLAPGDFLLLYTDGLTEMFSETGDTFGEENLIRVIKEAPHTSATALAEYIKAALDEFRGLASASDDLTLLVLYRKRESA